LAVSSFVAINGNRGTQHELYVSIKVSKNVPFQQEFPNLRNPTSPKNLRLRNPGGDISNLAWSLLGMEPT